MKQSIIDAIIRNAAIKSGIAARDKDICARRSAVTLRIRDYFLKQAGLTVEEITRLGEMAKDINERVKDFGYVDLRMETSSFSVNVGGHYHDLSLDGTKWSRYDEAATLFSDSRATVEHRFAPAWHRNTTVYPFDSARDELMALDGEAKKLRAEYDTLCATITAQVKPVRTIKALLKVWPEAVELLPEAEQPKPQSTELALDVATLNALCGVPSDGNK